MHETDTTSQHPAHANFDHASVSEKLSAEAGLLSSLPQSAARGLEKRIQNAGSNLPATIAEASCFAVAGCAVGLIVRNPAIVGEACVPLINTASKWAPPIFAGVMGADLAGKTIPSMAKTWNAPASLPDIKIEMGDRIGSTIFDYSLAGIAGSAGHALSGPSERALASIGRRLVQVEERPMAFVAAGGHEIHTRSVEPSAWADYTAFSKPWQKGTAPDSIITSSNIIDAKELQSRPYKSGDILLGTIKSEFGDALRFFTQINVGEAGWRNADFMHRAVAHLYHGVNEFQMGLKREAIATWIQSHSGKKLLWDPYLETPKQSAYRAERPNSPTEYVPTCKSPDTLSLKEQVFRGDELPLINAKSLPEPGSIWLKYMINAEHSTRHNGIIEGRIFDGNTWQPLRLELMYGSRRLHFDSLIRANEIATQLEADLKNIRWTAAAIHDGARMWGYELK